MKRHKANIAFTNQVLKETKAANYSLIASISLDQVAENEIRPVLHSAVDLTGDMQAQLKLAEILIFLGEGLRSGKLFFMNDRRTNN